MPPPDPHPLLARATLMVALVWLLVAGCGGRQAAKPHGEVAVARIALEGNRSVDSDTLLGGLALTRLRDSGQEFEPYLVGVDLERLRGFYYRHGFFRVQVRSNIKTRGKQVEITFVIDEGPRARLARVEIAGLPDDPEVSRDEIRAQIALEDGEIFEYETYDLAKPLVIAALDRAGYAHAKMEATVAADRVLDEAIIRFEIEPGPLCQFGPVTMTGVDGPLADAARARLPIEPGQRYSATRVADAQAALYDMGRFSVVRVEPDRTAGVAEVPVAITVAESPRHELRLGGGIGIDPATYEVHGRAGYSVAGWPRPLLTSRLELRPAYSLLRAGWEQEPRLEALSSIERLDLFRPRMRGEVEASFAYLTVEAYTSVGPRLRLGLRTPIYRDTINVSAGWQLRRLEFRRLDAAIDAATATELGLDDPYLLGFYEQSVSVDLRDDPVAPRRGGYGEISVEEGTVAAGGEFDYLRLTPDLRGYVPLGPLVFAARSRLGVIFGDLPVTQRFFAGGASSQRGFPVRRLAPTVTSTVDGEPVSVVIGGGASLEVGGELRAFLGTIKGLQLGGVLFLDGADVTERVGDLDLTHLHWAAGAGLRIATLIGPVRIDVGYRLNRTGVGEPQAGEHLAYHLSLGEAF